MWIIYKHTNKINGKSYIGQTLLETKERWRSNGCGYKQSSVFYSAIQKYGWDNFTHEILVDNIATIEEANKLEKYYIQYYHTWLNDPKCNGYNILPGGTIDNRYLIGKPIYQIDVHKNIIAEYISSEDAARILFTNNLDSAANSIRACCQGKLGHFKGYYFCYKTELETYQFIKRKNSPKVVLQLDSSKNILKRYVTLQDAASAVGVTVPHIKQCCDGDRLKSGGYWWCYELDYDDYQIQIPEDWPQAKVVVQLDKKSLKEIARFPSANTASKQTGISRGNINTCCRGQLKSAGGYVWKYIEDSN